MWNKVPKNEYHKGKPGKKKDPFKKDVIVIDNKSMMGYRDDSPYRNLPIIDINTPSGYIDMSATGIPLFANGQYLPPYSGQHFMGTNVVRETPVWDKGFDIPPPPGHIDFIDKGFDIPSKTTARYYPGHPEYFQQGGDPSIPELDQAKKGGWLNNYSKMPKKTSSKNIKTSINKLMTKNPLFERNYMLYGAKGPRLYNPSSKYQFGGWLDEYQEGGVTPITTEEDYNRRLLMKNKSKEELAAQNEWVAKKMTISQYKASGNSLPPIYTEDPNDPRLKLYNDSLATSNWTQRNLDLWTQAPVHKPLVFASSANTPATTTPSRATIAAVVTKARPITPPKDFVYNRPTYDPTKPISESNDPKDSDDPAIRIPALKRLYTIGPWNLYPNNQRFLRRAQEAELYNGRVGLLNHAPITSNIQPVGGYNNTPLNPHYKQFQNTNASIFPIYKKPVQPIILGKPPINAQFRKQETNFGPVYYWQLDPVAQQWYQISEQAFNNNTSNGTVNAEVVPWVNPMIPAYKKPVQQVVVKKTPEQKARELKPIESKLTPMEVAPEPALYKAPTRQPLYKKTQEPNLPPFYWQFDPVAKQWYQISERTYNNAPAQQKKKGGNIGWLDSYQGGGVTINSEEEYKKSLLMKNKTKERMDAERAWASKKVAAANAAKVKKPAPSAQQLFGIQPVAVESTGVNKTPQAGLDYKNEVAQSFHKAVDNKMKEKPNLTREQAQTQVNIENTYAQGRAKGQGTIRQADPEQGLLSKTVEVVSHPFNALDAYVQSGYVPDYFSHNKDAVNPMDVAYSVTPAGWYTQGADALYNDLPTDIEQGNWMGAANDLLMGLPLGVKAAQLGRTYIPQTYKINPWAFKPNPEAYYRVMPNAGAEDLFNSGFVRPAKSSSTSYFNKGVPLDIRRAKTFGTDTREFYHGYDGPYMIESNNPNAFDPWLQFPEPSLKFYTTKAPIPASDIKLYKEDWLRGYKPVDVPTQLPGSPNNIVPKTPPNPALGNPTGTVDDLKRMARLEKYGLKTEGDFPLYQRKLDTDLIKYNNEMDANLNIKNPNPTQADKLTGYTDIPQFNQQVQNFNTEMQFGKRPLETQINIRPETQRLLGEKAFTESTGDYPMYFNVYGTPYETVPGLNLKRRNPLSGYEMFQQIQPNKYGGSPRKSDKKLVNYSQNPNFVKTSWLDKYK